MTIDTKKHQVPRLHATHSCISKLVLAKSSEARKDKAGILHHRQEHYPRLFCNPSILSSTGYDEDTDVDMIIVSHAETLENAKKTSH